MQGILPIYDSNKFNVVALMFDLSNIYKPITGKPFISGDYISIPPVGILKPYVCNYWISNPFLTTNEYSITNIIIPDTCSDIIMEIDHTTDSIHTIYCAIQNAPFTVHTQIGDNAKTLFGIRFYSWAMGFFIDDSLKGYHDNNYDIDGLFRDFKSNIGQNIVREKTIEGKIRIVERYLYERLVRKNRSNSSLLNALFAILNTKGTTSVLDIGSYSQISKRQLERIFNEYIGSD